MEWVEHQLAHAVLDALGRAHNRTTHLPQRKEMMQKMGDYLDALRLQAQRDYRKARPWVSKAATDSVEFACEHRGQLPIDAPA